MNATDAAAVQELAGLDPIAYGRTRKAAAERLKVPVAALDRAVQQQRPPAATEPGPGRALTLVEIPPAEQAIDGGQLADLIVGRLHAYVVLSDHAAVAVTLWIFRAHGHDLFDMNPRLALASPTMRCGKTTTLEILSGLVQRPLPTSNVTSAVLFRTIEAARPTLIIDELDAFSGDNDELRGLLNSGHRKATAQVIRLVGDNYEPRVFSTWCPMVLATIGRLSPTLEDRSLVISMKRKAAGERVIPLRWSGRGGGTLRAVLATLAAGCTRWVLDHATQLREAEPEIPDGLNDRQADNWSPLLAIADELGGGWPARARAAAQALSTGEGAETESAGVQLLTDIRHLFETDKIDKLGSADLCGRLAGLEERPWSDWKHGKPLSPNQLARLLRPFAIRSRTLRLPNDQRLNGYPREDFEETWTRYLPTLAESPLSKHDVMTTRASRGDPSLFQSVTDQECHESENAVNPAPGAECHTVTDQNPEIWEEGVD